MKTNTRTVFEILNHYIREYEKTLEQPETWDNDERRFSIQAHLNLLKLIRLDIELEGTEVVR